IPQQLSLTAFVFTTTFLVLVASITWKTAAATQLNHPQAAPFDSTIEENVRQSFTRGRDIFRFDTFGSEAFWGGRLRLHQAIAGARFGGVGGGLSPTQSLAVG